MSLFAFALCCWQPVAVAVPPGNGQAAAFDDLLERLEEAELATLTPAQSLERLDALARLRPADGSRELRYRTLRCDWAFDDDARGQLAYADTGLAAAHKAGDSEAQARFHYCRAAALEMLGATDDVMAAYEAGLAASRLAENNRLLADGLAARGGRRSLLGDQARAVPDLLAALRLYQRGGFNADAELLLLDIGISYRRMGEHGKALDYLQQNEAFVTGRGDWSALISNLLQQGYLAEDDGRVDDALAAYGRALASAQQHDSRYDMASVHLAMAYPWILQGDYRRALQLLETAQSGFAALGDRTNQEMIALRRGQAHAGLGQHVQALADFQQAAAAMERSGNQRYLAMLYRARARTRQALGQSQAAYADLERYVDLHGRIVGAERSQQAQLLRSQFDSDRQALENNRLASEKALREHQLQALLQARRWQWTAMALGAVLLLLLGALIMRQLVRMRRLRELASTDPLTGVANRRSIELLGADAFARARSAGEHLSILVLDVDHFKQVNDCHGHPTGDQVLARIAHTCRDTLRQLDRLGRTGGEEFLVLLPATRLDQARPIAERLRAAVAAIDFSDIDTALAVTVSIGMAELAAADAGLRDLVARGDVALYRAKANGRNRVETEA